MSPEQPSDHEPTLDEQHLALIKAVDEAAQKHVAAVGENETRTTDLVLTLARVNLRDFEADHGRPHTTEPEDQP